MRAARSALRLISLASTSSAAAAFVPAAGRALRPRAAAAAALGGAARPVAWRRYASSDAPLTEDEGTVRTAERKIREAFNPTELRVNAAYDDPNGSHISVYIVSDKFEGKRSMQRQQLVFKAIWDEMQSGAIHAVDNMVAKTPAEVEAEA